MPAQTHEERDGALMRRLREAAQGRRGGRFGFVAGAAQTERRDLLIVARVAQGADPRHLRALVEAGADALEVRVRSGDTGALLAAVSAVEVPVGFYIGESEGGDLTTVASVEGVDWLHLSLQAPAALLSLKGLTRAVSLPPDLPPGRLAGLSGLSEITVVDDATAAHRGLTIETLLALRTVQGATKGALLVGLGLGLLPTDIEVLRDNGIAGLLLDDDVEAIARFSTAIAALEDDR